MTEHHEEQSEFPKLQQCGGGGVEDDVFRWTHIAPAAKIR